MQINIHRVFPLNSYIDIATALLLSGCTKGHFHALNKLPDITHRISEALHNLRVQTVVLLQTVHCLINLMIGFYLKLHF